MEKCHKLLCKIILFVQVVVKVVSHTAVPRFKILVALYQAVIVLPDLYGIEMPSGYYHSLGWLEALKFDWSDVVIPGSCLVGGLKIRLLLRGLVPLLLMLSPLVLSIVQHMISYCRGRVANRADLATASFGKGFKAAVMRALPAVLSISFCLVQTVSTGIFSAWDCREFVFDSASGRTKQFLREDLSVECDTGEHSELKHVAYVFTAIWPIGMPLLYLLVLVPCRHELMLRISTPLTRATSFLHGEYTTQYWWWETLFVLQRLMITGFVMFLIQAQDAVRRITAGIVITMVYSVMLLHFRPYRLQDLNFLAAVGSQFALTIIMVVALFMRLFNDIQQECDLDRAQRIMRFKGPDEIAGITIASAFIAICIVTVRTAYEASEEIKVIKQRFSERISSTSNRFFGRVSSAMGRIASRAGQDESRLKPSPGKFDEAVIV